MENKKISQNIAQQPITAFCMIAIFTGSVVTFTFQMLYMLKLTYALLKNAISEVIQSRFAEYG